MDRPSGRFKISYDVNSWKAKEFFNYLLGLPKVHKMSDYRMGLIILSAKIKTYRLHNQDNERLLTELIKTVEDLPNGRAITVDQIVRLTKNPWYAPKVKKAAKVKQEVVLSDSQRQTADWLKTTVKSFTRGDIHV